MSRVRIVADVIVLILTIAMLVVIIRSGVFRRQKDHPPQPPVAINPSIIVAKDGTGNVSTISAAVAAAPDKSADPFGILIKEGVYREVVLVPRTKTNLAFIGEGANRTVVSSNRSEADGWDPMKTATLQIFGSGFLGINLTLENTSDPTKGVAAAVSVFAPDSAFHCCSFRGYQGTVNAVQWKQFFGECHIYGAVDMLWGNAAALFQNCTAYMRKPLPGQESVLTLQQRNKADSQTGFILHGGAVRADGRDDFSAYLGRPGGSFSRVVVLQVFLDKIVSPRGWSSGGNQSSLPPKGVYFAEYANRGPGGGTKGRVRWPGFKIIRTSSEALQFTANKFIEASRWLTKLPLKYVPGLM